MVDTTDVVLEDLTSASESMGEDMVVLVIDVVVLVIDVGVLVIGELVEVAEEEEEEEGEAADDH